MLGNLRTIKSLLFLILISTNVATPWMKPHQLKAYKSVDSAALATRKMSLSPSQDVGIDDNSKPKHVVIAGAGIIGLSTAFYLAENFGIASTLVDPSGEIAPAASGKAGGFLALDWNDYSPVGELARRSFVLHQELADRLGAENLQYRRLTCAGIGVEGRPGGKKLQGVEWAQDVDNSVVGIRSLGDESTIAQVHPKMLCENIWKTISAPRGEGGVGSKLVQGRVAKAVHNDDGTLLGAMLQDGSTVECDAVLFACGPWTANVMRGVKYHSVIIPTPRVLSQCVFFSGCGDPEVYVRGDSTAYCTGFPDPETIVKEEPGHEEIREDAVARIVGAVQKATGGTKEGAALSADPILTQACYLPTTPDGLPIMGELQADTVGGAKCYIAAGHSCWGILLGPATGETMASLIATGKGTDYVDLRPYGPSRYAGISLGQLSKTG